MNNNTKAYFPNAEAFEIFLDQCTGCKHLNNQYDECNSENDVFDWSLARDKPPYHFCSWGIIDRIVHGAANGIYEVELDQGDFDRTAISCKRFTRKDYELIDRDPPTPDYTGQQLLIPLTVNKETP